MDQPAAFNLLHEGVRRQLWKMGWAELRTLQVDAIRHILTSDQHAILSAGTASGKTEAAFLPVLSAIADEAAGSIRAIYIGPLKALINDQFERLEELCNHLDVPVHRWHGDVGIGAKKKLIEAPSGVLLITPESLESLFVNRSHALPKLFGGLRFAVIDELHAFLGSARGLHLRSLLHRVAALTAQPLRIVGLSATLGEPALARAYIDCDHAERVALIAGDGGEAELRMKLYAYNEMCEPEHVAETTDADLRPAPHDQRLAADLVRHCRGNSNLVFANSRSDVEVFGDLCNQVVQAEGLTDLFLVHHGSLSAEIREDTEETMKQSSGTGRPATTLCSSTLEMGIDIGSVKMVAQIGAPNGVASLKQRVGRSGRRKGAPRELRLYIRCRSIDQHADLFERMHLPLIQSIAVTELMLRGWVEPADSSSFDLSTLAQQVMSLIAETGGCRADVLYDVLCRKGAFRDVAPAEFTALLRQLGAEDVIEQTPEGELILGLVGEQLRKDKGFYAVFPTADAYVVLHDGRKIGMVDCAPRPNEHMLLAGRRWRVVDVDERQLSILVVHASGRKAAPFSGNAGILHDEIVRTMRDVLNSKTNFIYLDNTAAQLLRDARAAAEQSRACMDRFISLGAQKTAIMTWVGGRTLATLCAMLVARGTIASNKGVGLVVNESVERCRTLLDEIRNSPPDPDTIAVAANGLPLGKYDHLLGDTLRALTVKRRWLDLPAAQLYLSTTL